MLIELTRAILKPVPTVTRIDTKSYTCELTSSLGTTLILIVRTIASNEPSTSYYRYNFQLLES